MTNVIQKYSIFWDLELFLLELQCRFNILFVKANVFFFIFKLNKIIKSEKNSIIQYNISIDNSQQIILKLHYKIILGSYGNIFKLTLFDRRVPYADENVEIVAGWKAPKLKLLNRKLINQILV